MKQYKFNSEKTARQILCFGCACVPTNSKGMCTRLLQAIEVANLAYLDGLIEGHKISNYNKNK